MMAKPGLEPGTTTISAKRSESSHVEIGSTSVRLVESGHAANAPHLVAVSVRLVPDASDGHACRGVQLWEQLEGVSVDRFDRGEVAAVERDHDVRADSLGQGD